MFRPKKRPSPLLGTNPSIGLDVVLARAVTRSWPTRGPKSTTLVTVGADSWRRMGEEGEGSQLAGPLRLNGQRLGC